ncbi:alpha/beta fold hydrolase [Aerococcus kribbianus]|uniref:Alpha/beta hydrolase n=1 Tax=Aerococcus kribbianus TaxID=2999064 RepID=A0A9X3FLL5_9LACT|nr:alpha/beta fold hydrolase [Aerococcus sp. YH-aer222]MCZ0725018.1 alpha/beta hydrolase [Aerococcus sp. YH-aer222]
MTYQTLTHIPSAMTQRPYIPTYLWDNPHAKAIVHIVHGMSEHAQRYEKIANYLQKNGYLVVAHDHISHGPLAKEHNRLGYFGSNNASYFLVEDMHHVYAEIHNQYPDLPYFMLSHSMGAYLTRIYMQTYSQELAGVLLSGTNAYTPLSLLGVGLSPILNDFRPDTYNYTIHRQLFQTGLPDTSTNSNKLMNLWTKPSPEQTVDWPLIGFVFTNNGFAELIKIVHQATRPGWLRTVDPNLPIAIFTGRNDPLVNKGKETAKLAKSFARHQFADVSFYTFENRGHEIYMYGGTDIVFNYTKEWLDRQLNKNTARKN